ncbi:DUF6465 family protein [Clostridium sp. 'White wine YQ']|uniref:DUF6465 family protein n=1 Tax=Clostridium sp. 'White wine YQ' TaxID=3027474 RepID=UPI002366EA56|nr:DUF6465 family protein [Clostridium sp. 'White wine YQ']MDD7796031.1 DUF6465 family protein [Clostridium sp. 'White wine YQ']
MPHRKKVIDEVIDSVNTAAKVTSKKISTTLNKENVKKAVDGVKDTVGGLAEEGEKVVRTTARKAKKVTLKPELFIEYQGNQISQEDLISRVYSSLEGKVDLLKVKSLKLYFNVSENKVYVVINTSDTFIVDLN